MGRDEEVGRDGGCGVLLVDHRTLQEDDVAQWLGNIVSRPPKTSTVSPPT